MIYTTYNCQDRTRVFDVEAKRELRQVISLDTDSGVVYMAHDPVRVNATDDAVEMYAERYSSIYPIFGGYPLPCMFHCYGRVE